METFRSSRRVGLIDEGILQMYKYIKTDIIALQIYSIYMFSVNVFIDVFAIKGLYHINKYKM